MFTPIQTSSVSPDEFLSSERLISVIRLAAATSVCVAAGLSLSQPAVAQAQLSPNPNPAGDFIFLDRQSATNDGSYQNFGGIAIEGQGAALENRGLFENIGSLSASNASTINSEDSFESTGSLRLGDGNFFNSGSFSSSGSFTANDGSLFDNSGTASFSGPTDFQIVQLNNTGSLSNSGVFDIDLTGIENVGRFTNTGTIQRSSFGEAVGVTNRGSLFNTGNVVEVGLENSGLFVNEGTYNANSLSTSGFINDGGGTVLNNGLTSVRAGSSSSTGQFLNEGTLSGTGTFSNVFKSVGSGFVLGAGTVAPGGIFENDTVKDTAGVLTFDDNVVFDGGNLNISIGGFGAQESDLLNVEGSADLSGGVVNFSWLDGFDIASVLNPGETKNVSFLSAESGILDFASQVDFSQLAGDGVSFEVVQQNNDLVLSATRSAGPNEPDTIPTTAPTNPVSNPTVPGVPVVNPGTPNSPAPTDIPEPSLLIGFFALGGLSLRLKRQ